MVDEGIKKMEQLIEAYFNNDGQTAYVMTADHGMTDWGASVKVLLKIKLLCSSNMPFYNVQHIAGCVQGHMVQVITVRR